MNRPLTKLSRIGVLAVAAGSVLAGCGSSGDDTNSSDRAAGPPQGYENAGAPGGSNGSGNRPNLKDDNPNFSVYIDPTFTAPKGTKVTFEPTNNGNCAKNITNADYTTGDPPWSPGPKHMFIGVGEGSCKFETTSQQFKVTATYPDGSSKFRLLNIEQSPPIWIYSHTMTTVCAFGELPCVGGDDTQPSTHGKAPTPPVQIG